MSLTIRPVTQVAEVAVNAAFINDVFSPVTVAAGSISKIVPTPIAKIKLDTINCVGCNLNRENNLLTFRKREMSIVTMTTCQTITKNGVFSNE